MAFGERVERNMDDNRPEPKHIGICPYCKDSLYEGDEALIDELTGAVVCKSASCLARHVKKAGYMRHVELGTDRESDVVMP
jgi:hypothetical protein